MIDKLPTIVLTKGSSELDTTATGALDAIVDTLAAHPELDVIEIGGHAGATGATDADAALARHRAVVIVRYLVGKGVAATRLTAKGYPPEPKTARDPDRVVPTIVKRHAPTP